MSTLPDRTLEALGAGGALGGHGPAGGLQALFGRAQELEIAAERAVIVEVFIGWSFRSR